MRRLFGNESRFKALLSKQAEKRPPQCAHGTPVVLEQYLSYVITVPIPHLLGFASQYSELGLHLTARARLSVMSPRSIIIAIVSHLNVLPVAGKHESAMAAHAAPAPMVSAIDFIE